MVISRCCEAACGVVERGGVLARRATARIDSARLTSVEGVGVHEALEERVKRVVRRDVLGHQVAVGHGSRVVRLFGVTVLDRHRVTWVKARVEKGGTIRAETLVQILGHWGWLAEGVARRDVLGHQVADGHGWYVVGLLRVVLDLPRVGWVKARFEEKVKEKEVALER